MPCASSVELTSTLKEFRKEHAKESKRPEPNFRAMLEPQRYARFLAEMDVFVARVLLEMKQIPTSPGRQDLTQTECLTLKGIFDPVDRSVWEIWSLMRIRASLVHRVRSDLSIPEGVQNLKDAYFGSGENLITYQKHMALRAWLFRRSAKHQEWAEKYYSREDVKKRGRERISLEDDAKRQYFRYWAKKGVINPPPWKPRRRRSNVIPFPQRKSS